MTKQTAGELLKSLRLGPTANQRHRARIREFDKRKKKRESAVSGKANWGGWRSVNIDEPQNVNVPPDVLADRDRRMAMDPRPFGDPPPGHREYLDSLAATQRARR